MIRRPPRSTRTDTLFPYTTLFRSTYQDTIDNTVHLAMVKGNLDATTPTLIRVHLRNTLQDVLGVEHEDFAWPLRRALKRIADEGTGVRSEERRVGKGVSGRVRPGGPRRIKKKKNQQIPNNT